MSKPAVFPAPGDNKSEIEEGTVFAPRFDADGLIPVVTTSASTGEVLMFAYMNADALALTIETGEAHYWSRSRGKLWRKGETSGNCSARGRDAHRLRPRRPPAQDRDDGRRGVLPHRTEVMLLSRPPRGRGDREERRRAPHGRRRAAVRPRERLSSRWCRKGNLKEIRVRYLAARGVAFGQAHRTRERRSRMAVCGQAAGPNPA